MTDTDRSIKKDIALWDLESRIASVAQLLEDLDALTEQLEYDLSEDELFNYINGLRNVYDFNGLRNVYDLRIIKLREAFQASLGDERPFSVMYQLADQEDKDKITERLDELKAIINYGEPDEQ